MIVWLNTAKSIPRIKTSTDRQLGLECLDLLYLEMLLEFIPLKALGKSSTKQFLE